MRTPTKTATILKRCSSSIEPYRTRSHLHLCKHPKSTRINSKSVRRTARSPSPINSGVGAPLGRTLITLCFRAGVFEFVRDGQRCSRIFTNLERLVDFTTRNPCMVVFMSRDRLKGHILDPVGATWSVKKYCQGAIFRAQRINRSSDAANEQHKSSSDHLECLDEYNYSVFLNMNEPGRFSLITTLTDQRQSQPELFLHNTQTPNIGSLIKRLAPSNHSTETNRACIRLVRGSVPHNFHCQYLRFIRQHAHDVLVGLTQQGLIIEWNLDSDTPCRYATNLNEILSELSLTWDEQLLENYIDRARANYRDNFRSNFQLTSTKDWAAFYQYWKWTGDIRPTGEQSAHIPYQSRHRFHVIASIQVRLSLKLQMNSMT